MNDDPYCIGVFVDNELDETKHPKMNANFSRAV